MKEREKEQLKRTLEVQLKTEPEKVVDLVIALTERIEALESRLNKNSSNSSKPPSSDQGKKTKSLRTGGNRKSGGQMGHEGKTLEQVKSPDETLEHKLEICPVTGKKLSDKDIVDVIVRQVFELPEPKLHVTEHRIYVYGVAGSHKTVHAEIPPDVGAHVQYGKGFESFLVYLKDNHLMSLRGIAQLCSDLYGYSVSEGTLLKAKKNCALFLEPFEDAVINHLQNEEVVHADESGFRIEKKRHWLHVVSSENYTLYGVHESRGYEAIESMGVLPDYTGHLMHDCWQTYFMINCSHGLCNPHLLRELKYFDEEEDQPWAKQMEQYLWDAYNNPESKTLQAWRNGLTRIVNKGYIENPFDPPDDKGKKGRKAQPPVINLLDRLWYYRDYYLSFLTQDSYPFSNNQAEQDVRMLKVQQKISGCFRTWKGAIEFARVRSYISSARKQKQNVLKALKQAMNQQPMFT